jgi:hypothetical protein
MKSKPEGHGFDLVWRHLIFQLTYHSCHTVSLRSIQPVTEMSTRETEAGV